MREAAQDDQGADEGGDLGVIGAVLLEGMEERAVQLIAFLAALTDFPQRGREVVRQIAARAERLAELLQGEAVLAQRAALPAREPEGSDACRDALFEGDVLRRRSRYGGFHGRKSTGVPR